MSPYSRRRLYAWGGVCLVLFAVGVLVYSSDKILFRSFEKIDDAFWPHQRVFGKVRNGIGKSLDSLNPSHNSWNILSALDVYELRLSPPDVRYFYLTTPPASSPEEWDKPGQDFRKIELHHKGLKYDAKMKLHGDTVAHWSDRKKSFQLKASKEESPEGRNRLIFNIPEKRNYLAPLFANRLAAKMGLPEVASGYAAVKINGAFQGTYYVEEYLDSKWLERKGISNGALVHLSDNWLEDRLDSQNDPNRYFGGITFNDHHTTPFDLEISNLKEIASPLKSDLSAQWVAGKAHELFEAIETQDEKRFEDLVDVEKIGAIDAWRTLFGDKWTIFGDNLRMVYLFTGGKFFFVPRSQGACLEITYRGGSFESHLNSLPTSPRIVPLLALITRSEKIRAARNRWLQYFVQNRASILEEYDRLIAHTLPILSQDNTLRLSSRELRHEVLESRRVLAENLDRLTRQFHHVKAYANFVVSGNTARIEIVPDTSLQFLGIQSLRLSVSGKEGPETRPARLEQYDPGKNAYTLLQSVEFENNKDLAAAFSGVSFGYDYNEDFLPVPKRHVFRLVFEGEAPVEISKVELQMRALQSTALLPPTDVYVTLARRDTQNGKANLGTLGWKENGSFLLLPKGRWILTEDIRIPAGYTVQIEKGTEILMAPNVSLLSFSPIVISGTAEEPVKIRALDPSRPFATFAVETSRSMEKFSKISWLELSGGNEAVLDGIYFSGALCIYQGNLEMDHSKISGNFADDGLNVKYGKISIRDSEFSLSAADQIDLDFCEGVVRDSRFLSSGKVENGDGLDISGSRLLVRNCLFENFLDKGLSIGEDSRVVIYESRFVRNQRGSAVKDSSTAIFLRNQFHENETAITAYRKKPIFAGEERIFAYENRSSGNGAWFEGDSHSRYFVPTETGKTYLRDWLAESWKLEEADALQRNEFWQRFEWSGTSSNIS